jgi:hypothetical protein
MTSAIGIAILAVVGIWLIGGLLARVTGALLVVVGSVGLASTGDANGFLLVTLGAALWLVGHLLFRARRGVWKSALAERVFFAATAFRRNKQYVARVLRCSGATRADPTRAA